MNELVVQLAAKAGACGALSCEVLTNEVSANEGAESEVSESEVSAKNTPAKKAFAKKAVGKKAVAIILGSLPNEGAAGTVQALIDKIPDAEATIEAPGGEAVGGGGGLGGLLGSRLMARRGKLIGLGLSMRPYQSVICELLRFDRDRVAADRMGHLVCANLAKRLNHIEYHDISDLQD